MARYLKRNPVNPDIFGEDIFNLALEGVGVGGTALVSQKLINPLLSQVSGSMVGGEIGKKVVDTIGCGVSAWLASEVAGIVDANAARQVRRGGAVYTAVAALSILIPGFSITGTLPTAIGGFTFPTLPSFAGTSVSAAESRMLPPGSTNGANNGIPETRLLGVASMGI